MQQPDGHASRMEAACQLLAAPVRRYLLYVLAGEGHDNLDTLVPQIVAWLDDEPPAFVDDARCHTLRISLVHNHLPRLQEHDIVEYDLRSGDVVRSDGFSDIESLLRQFRETEDQPELRNLNVP